MGFLKRLFGGGPASRDTDGQKAIILYVKVRKCSAIARVRVDRYNDLSLDDGGENYVVRKQIVDNVCYGTAELIMRFDAAHREVSRTVENGEIVTCAEWEEQERLRIAPH